MRKVNEVQFFTMEHDGFKLFRRRKRQERNYKAHDEQTISYVPQNICRMLETHRETLKTSKILDQILNANTLKFEEIVSFGLGCLNTRNSRVQLALLMLISDHFRCRSVTAYDPKTTTEEQMYLSSIGIEKDECTDCMKKVKTPTLFFMIHCSLWMYENIIRANRENLSMIYIIGNSFDALGIGCNREIQLSVSDDDLEFVFNNTSLHSFSEN